MGWVGERWVLEASAPLEQRSLTLGGRYFAQVGGHDGGRHAHAEPHNHAPRDQRPAAAAWRQAAAARDSKCGWGSSWLLSFFNQTQPSPCLHACMHASTGHKGSATTHGSPRGASAMTSGPTTKNTLSAAMAIRLRQGGGGHACSEEGGWGRWVGQVGEEARAFEH